MSRRTTDANGNPTGAGYVVGLNNELLADPQSVYGYDAEGNRTRKVDRATGAVTEYQWDASFVCSQIVILSTSSRLNLSSRQS